MQKKPKILVIVGPTASGKTALSIKLARKLGGEIVSADSRQIYRGMDIGTAKPPFSPASTRSGAKTSVPRSDSRRGTTYAVEGIPHHLIDIKNPDEDYTVAEYKRDAIKAIRGILRRGKLPILAGGTGLYVNAVIYNLDIPQVEAQPKLRKKIENELREKGLFHLFKKLVELDSEATYIVDPKNPRRIIRALEVAITTGKPFTAQRKQGAPLFDAQIIGIKVPKTVLRKRINQRINKMIESGLLDEVKAMHKKYGGVKALDAIGYREIIDCLDKKTSLQSAVEQMKIDTWNYARRQMTWFKKTKGVRWFSYDKLPKISTLKARLRKSA